MDEGFDEIIIRQWAADLDTGIHQHPFDVSVVLVQGEFWLSVGPDVKHLKAGDAFRLAREVPHAERYGPEGATVWVARAN
jgi:quercetin dioxygenase-like cupin family protein